MRSLLISLLVFGLFVGPGLGWLFFGFNPFNVYPIRSRYVNRNIVCPLVEYSNTNVIGYKGFRVKIEPGFKSYMDNINTWARQCDVTVYVTHAFRLKGQNLGGTVVPPTSKSNHPVGHAIDMNLQTSTGWCNSKCLQGKSKPGAVCFINKVKSGGMRWGGDFARRDPVHIDDGINVNNMGKWKSLFKQLQRDCK